MPLYHTFLNFVSSIRLPEYGYIGITEIEKKIIDTKYFQRLRRIKQSSSLYMAFPGASHSRYEHSLGAMHIAGEAAVYIILNSKNKINSTSIIEILDSLDLTEDIKKQIQITRLAALLHDIGHAPFSHTFEEFLKLVNPKIEWKHEYLGLEIIYKKLGAIFSKCSQFNIEPYEVMALLCDLSHDFKIKENIESVIKKIGVSQEHVDKMNNFIKSYWYLNHLIKEDPYNVDRFNYLILDSNRSGAREYGYIDVERIIQNLFVVEKDKIITVSTNAKDAAMRFFEAYSHMHRSIYLDKVSQGADVHLSYVMKESSKEHKSLFNKLSIPDMETLLDLYDDVLIYELTKATDEKTRKLVDDYLNRNIFSLVYEFNLGDNNPLTRIMEHEGSEGLQNKIKELAKLSKNDVVLIINTLDKKAAKPPVDEITLKKLTFYNVRCKKLESLDIDLSKQFLSTKKYRIYCEKEHKHKIKESINSIVIY